MTAKTRIRVELSSSRVEILWEICYHGHILKIKATRCTRRDRVVVHGKVTITVGIGARRGDVGWIEDVDIHKSKLVKVSLSRENAKCITHISLEVFVPLSMTFLNMLSPETFALK